MPSSRRTSTPRSIWKSSRLSSTVGSCRVGWADSQPRRMDNLDPTPASLSSSFSGAVKHIQLASCPKPSGRSFYLVPIRHRHLAPATMPPRNGSGNWINKLNNAVFKKRRSGRRRLIDKGNRQEEADRQEKKRQFDAEKKRQAEIEKQRQEWRRRLAEYQTKGPEYAEQSKTTWNAVQVTNEFDDDYN